MTPSQPSPRPLLPHDESSPLPWRLHSDAVYIVDGKGRIIVACRGTWTSGTEDKMNAALIVQAVNGHGVVSEEEIRLALNKYEMTGNANIGAFPMHQRSLMKSAIEAVIAYRAAIVAALAARGGGK